MVAAADNTEAGQAWPAIPEPALAWLVDLCEPDNLGPISPRKLWGESVVPEKPLGQALKASGLVKGTSRTAEPTNVLRQVAATLANPAASLTIRTWQRFDRLETTVLVPALLAPGTSLTLNYSNGAYHITPGVTPTDVIAIAGNGFLQYCDDHQPLIVEMQLPGKAMVVLAALIDLLRGRYLAEASPKDGLAALDEPRSTKYIHAAMDAHWGRGATVDFTAAVMAASGQFQLPGLEETRSALGELREAGAVSSSSQGYRLAPELQELIPDVAGLTGGMQWQLAVLEKEGLIMSNRVMFRSDAGKLFTVERAGLDRVRMSGDSKPSLQRYLIDQLELMVFPESGDRQERLKKGESKKAVEAPESERSEKNFCTHCGAKSRRGAKFCTRCGAQTARVTKSGRV